MKTFTLHITLIFSFMVFSFSCSNVPDTDTILLYIRASEAYSQGRFLQVSEILKKTNDFPPGVILRAKAEYFNGDFEKAENSCRRAIKLRPSSLEAGFYLARVLREKGDLERAAEITRTILIDNPQDIRTLRFAADLAAERGKFDEAVILLDRAAEYSAESAMVLLDRARLRWIAGRSDDALEDLSRARAMLPWETPLLRSITNLENIITEVR